MIRTCTCTRTGLREFANMQTSLKEMPQAAREVVAHSQVLAATSAKELRNRGCCIFGCTRATQTPMNCQDLDPLPILLMYPY